MGSVPSGWAAGPAERELRLLGRRHAAVARIVVVLVAGLLALLTAPVEHLLPTLGAVAWAVVGGLVYSVRLAAQRLRGLLPTDLVVTCGICLSQGWTVATDAPRDQPNWVWFAATITVVAYQWHTGPGRGAAATLTVAAAYCAGSALLGDVAWPRSLWLIATAALSRWLFVLVRREGRRADGLRARQERLRRDVAVARARRADTREQLAALHDTAASTLLMAGMGAVNGSGRAIAEQANRDLEVLTAGVRENTGDVDLNELLDGAVGRSGLRVEWTRGPALMLPAATAAAFLGSVREALTNVARHAGVGSASLRAGRQGHAVVVTVADAGRGFVPADVPPHHRGLSDSVVERMARVGGHARVDSAPGRGTRVRLEWSGDRGGLAGPLTAAPAAPAVARAFAAVTAGGFLHGLRTAAWIITAVTLMIWELPMLLRHTGQYRSPAWQFTAFAVTLAVVALCGVLLRVAQGHHLDRWRWPLLSVVLAMTLLSDLGVAADDLGTSAQWAYGNPGWFAVVLLMGRGLVPLLAVMAADLTLTLVPLFLAGRAGPHTLTTVLLGSVVIWGSQLAVGLSAQTLRRTAHAAALTAAEEERLRAEEVICEHLHRDRQQRYAALAETVVPLLAGIAAGDLDPRQEPVRRACARESARLRRLFAEHDDAPDPLVHELRACIDVVERNGVTVVLATRGSRPALPREVRRALTEPVIAALAAAREAARVTVLASPQAVTVSVVSDARQDRDAIADGPAGERVTVSAMTSEDQLWVEATWRTAKPATTATSAATTGP
ncbi:ATP-binding protein [Streptomyces sp. NPDC046261]|uniref:sensor histidine kinase n=1 Tax=Streptomyces sp. NPDC046261 TaxID=3157200 RepID=UPI0033EBBFD0